MAKSPKASVDPAAIDAQLSEIAKALSASPTLSARERKVLRDRARHAPDALIALVLTTAERNGGVVTLEIDVAAERALVAQVASARAAADTARRIAAQLDDIALERGGPLASRALAAYVALRRLRHAPNGEPMARVFEEMAAIVRDERRPKRRGGSAKSEPSK